MELENNSVQIHMKQKRGYLFILIAGILWGSIGFFVTLLKNQGADSSTIAFLRIGVGAVLLVPMMLAMGGTKIFRIDKKGLFICFLLGLLSQAMFNFSYNVSIENVGVATASVLLYTSPIFVCIMSRIVFKEKIGLFKVLALGINVLGCVLTVTNGDFSTISFSPLGVAAGLCAGFLYALMTILSKPTTGKYNSLTILFYSFMFGALFLAIISKPWNNISEIYSTQFLLTAAGYGLIPTVGSYFFYMKGLGCKVETSKVPVVASIETVVAAFIGILVFHEASGFVKMMGIICVVISIALMNSSKEAADGE